MADRCKVSPGTICHKAVLARHIGDDLCLTAVVLFVVAQLLLRRGQSISSHVFISRLPILVGQPVDRFWAASGHPVNRVDADTGHDFARSEQQVVYAYMPAQNALRCWHQCLVGFLFESIGDFQTSCFQSAPANVGKVIDRGLWRYTLHPNYFGDFCVWWA